LFNECVVETFFIEVKIFKRIYGFNFSGSLGCQKLPEFADVGPATADDNTLYLILGVGGIEKVKGTSDFSAPVGDYR